MDAVEIVDLPSAGYWISHWYSTIVSPRYDSSASSDIVRSSHHLYIGTRIPVS
jgi:hypothetical protein